MIIFKKKRAKVKSKKEISIDLPFGVERTQSNYHEKLEKTKEKYPNAYEPWTSEADEKIKQLHNQGKSNSELSKIFQRRSGASKQPPIRDWGHFLFMKQSCLA